MSIIKNIVRTENNNECVMKFLSLLIGDIAKISFLKDPDGNWIEVAQRASLAGPWD